MNVGVVGGPEEEAGEVRGTERVPLFALTSEMERVWVPGPVQWWHKWQE